mmetsp:Transcript_2489/g.5582  ORF Transcript_2489/g.5582 Transcript_2489/m.5582 type:complete len:88 (+) Transcript_2489:532-795(+)
MRKPPCDSDDTNKRSQVAVPVPLVIRIKPTNELLNELLLFSLCNSDRQQQSIERVAVRSIERVAAVPLQYAGLVVVIWTIERVALLL